MAQEKETKVIVIDAFRFVEFTDPGVLDNINMALIEKLHKRYLFGYIREWGALKLSVYSTQIAGNPEGMKRLKQIYDMLHNEFLKITPSMMTERRLKDLVKSYLREDEMALIMYCNNPMCEGLYIYYYKT